MAALLLAGALLFGCDRSRPAPAPAPTTAPATQTSPATTQAAIPRTYIDLVRASHPEVASTQPLSIPLDLREAAHLRLSDPIYLCSRGDLWITHAGAPPAEKLIPTAVDEPTHVTGDRVLYVHWAPNDESNWRPSIVRPHARSTSGVELVNASGAHPLPSRQYHWRRAISFNEKLIVPTSDGLSVFLPTESGEVRELHQALAAPPVGAIQTVPQVVFDARGLLVWAPWDNGQRGSRGAVRLVNETWTPLVPGQGWAERIVQLVPLLDGSVLQLALDQAGRLKPALLALDSQPVDERQVEALVEKLSDIDPNARQQAFEELTRYGPGIFPLLEKLRPQQPPEADIRIEQLLAGRLEPSLGGMRLSEGKVIVASRLEDGGVVLCAEKGADVPSGDNSDEADHVAPAWIVIRPGRAIHLLDAPLTNDAEPGKQQFFAPGQEWVISDDVQGPRRLLGNHVAPLLKPDERAFDWLAGIDRRGRWLFRTAPDSLETLILDPTIPDPTPRLPVWLMYVRGGNAGWNRGDWPAIDRGGGWVLEEAGWRPLNESKDELFTELPKGQHPWQPTSRPAGAATRAAAAAMGEPLLIDDQGNAWYDGRMTLHLVRPGGQHVVWPLPVIASAGPLDTPRLVSARDGRFFLFNTPGRVIRIKPTPGGKQPFSVEGIFTHRIPVSTDIRRIWLDPAGRIIIAYDGDRLAILFPDGHIPPAIATLIPARELED